MLGGRSLDVFFVVIGGKVGYGYRKILFLVRVCIFFLSVFGEIGSKFIR